MIKLEISFIKPSVDLYEIHDSRFKIIRTKELKAIVYCLVARVGNPRTAVRRVPLRSCCRVRLKVLRRRASFLCFQQRAILCVELHPVLRTSLGFGKFGFGECYEGYASWADLAVVGKLSRAFVTRTRHRPTSAPITDEVDNHIYRLFIFASSNNIQQIQHWPRAHPNLGGPTTSGAEPVVRIKLGLVNEDTDLYSHDFLQIHEGLCASLAVFHSIDFGFLHHSFKG